jgi:hypothetical protein
VEAIVLSAECPSVIDEVVRCLQLGPWASNFASETKLVGSSRQICELN